MSNLNEFLIQNDEIDSIVSNYVQSHEGVSEEYVRSFIDWYNNILVDTSASSKTISTIMNGESFGEGASDGWGIKGLVNFYNENSNIDLKYTIYEPDEVAGEGEVQFIIFSSSFNVKSIVVDEDVANSTDWNAEDYVLSDNEIQNAIELQNGAEHDRYRAMCNEYNNQMRSLQGTGVTLQEAISQATETAIEEGQTAADNYGQDEWTLWDGLVSIVMYIFRIIPVTIAEGIGKIISTIGSIITGTDIGEGLTLDKILFNEVEITSIDFFESSSDPSVNSLRNNVAMWYVGIRNLSAIILALILLYVGIRMAISSVAEDKARYKKMLFNWVLSLGILFFLHILMQAVIFVNNSLVDIMSNARADGTAENFDSVMNHFAADAWDIKIDTVTGITYALIYLLLSVMTFIFLLTYIMRMLTIAFLIMIAPIITITYSIDKMGDGKSQALNNWLKEFVYNVLIQPFHCIIYLSLVTTAFNMLRDGSGSAWNLGPAVLCFVMVVFMYKAEDIVKTIFNFQASSMPKSIAQGAMFVTALNAMKGKGAKAPSAGGGGGSSRRRTPRTAPQPGGPAPQPGGPAPQPGGPTPQPGGPTPQPGGPTPQPGGGNPPGGGGPNGNNNQQRRQSRGNSRARKIAGAFVRGSVKATGALVGLTVGAATGNAGVAFTGMQAVGGFASNQMNNMNLRARQRAVARTYNDFEAEHPELDDTSRVAYSRNLLDGTIAARTRAEREYVSAMRDLNDLYEKAGSSVDEAGDQVEKTIEGVQDGTISELNVVMRFKGRLRRRGNNP